MSFEYKENKDKVLDFIDDGQQLNKFLQTSLQQFNKEKILQ